MVQAFSRPSSRGPVISIPFYPLCGCFHKKLIKESHGPHSGIGFKLKPRATDIPCLLFADDNLLLCKAAASSCNNLKSVIDDFCDASDQLVNFHKSNIVFSKKVNIHCKASLASHFNMVTHYYLGRYLGIFFSYYHPTKTDFDRKK